MESTRRGGGGTLWRREVSTGREDSVQNPSARLTLPGNKDVEAGNAPPVERVLHENMDDATTPDNVALTATGMVSCCVSHSSHRKPRNGCAITWPCCRERQIQGISFATHYRNTRRALNRAYQRAGTRGPSLYSARHQFKINARAAGISAWDLAYLMGHASTITAQCHYGRGRAQISAFTVAPAPAPGDPAPVIRMREASERPDQRIRRNPNQSRPIFHGP